MIYYNMMVDDGCVIIDTIYFTPEVGIATTVVVVGGRTICTAKREELRKLIEIYKRRSDDIIITII